jgi:hypothetical protein
LRFLYNTTKANRQTDRQTERWGMMMMTTTMMCWVGTTEWLIWHYVHQDK